MDPNVRYKWHMIAKMFGAGVVAPLAAALAIYCYVQEFHSFWWVLCASVAIIEWLGFQTEPAHPEAEK